jgi:hypothetical protein
VLGKGRAFIREENWADACDTLEEAVRLAEPLGDDAYETLIIALVLLEASLGEMRRVDDAERVAQRALALSGQRGDKLHQIAALGNRRWVRIARHDVAGAIDDQEKLMRLGREIGVLLTEYFGEWDLGVLLYQSGNLGAAAEHARRAVAIEERHPEIAQTAPVAKLALARILAYGGNDAEAREVLARIHTTLHHAAAEGRVSGALAPSEAVLMSMVDLATREATVDEWEALLERSARDAIEQVPIEVADLYGTWALRRGRTDIAKRAFEEAAARAARIPNIMEARIRKGLEATASRTT